MPFSRPSSPPGAPPAAGSPVALAPKCALDLLPAGEPFSMSVFSHPACVPRKKQSREAFRAGIERLAISPVYFLSVQRFEGTGGFREFLWVASSAALAARLPLNEMRTLACAVGRQPDDPWLLGKLCAKFFGAHETFLRANRPIGQFWKEARAASGQASDADLPFFRPEGGLGFSGWAARSIHRSRHGELPWEKDTGRRVGAALEAAQWGPLLAKEIRSDWQMRGFSDAPHANDGSRKEFAERFGAFLEAQALLRVVALAGEAAGRDAENHPSPSARGSAGRRL